MGAILILGRALDDHSPAMLYDAILDTRHAIYVGGDRMDYYRNGDLLGVFAEDAVLDEAQISRRYRFVAQRTYTEMFDMMRAAELMRWARDVGLAERLNDRQWRLLDPVRHFELVGPENKQKALRIRGLSGAEEVIALKLWDRELKRRERLRLKWMAELVRDVATTLDSIIKGEPENPLGEEMRRFAIGSVTTFAGARQLILDEVAGMSLQDGRDVYRALYRIEREVALRQLDKRQAERKEAERLAREAEEEVNLAVLESVVIPEWPKKETIHHTDGSMTFYTVYEDGRRESRGSCGANCD